MHAHTKSDIESHGLTQTEFAILEALYNKGPTLLGEVQKKVLKSSGGIIFFIDTLVHRGLVHRRLCESDRRARFAELTDAGQLTLIGLLKPLGHSAAAVEILPLGTEAGKSA